MDEALSNSMKLRVQTRKEVGTELQARLGRDHVYVTNDQVEAMTMGHRSRCQGRCCSSMRQHPELVPRSAQLSWRLHRARPR